MSTKRKYKIISVEKILDKRWHIGAFICKDLDQFYLMLSLGKIDIYIGKLINWNWYDEF